MKKHSITSRITPHGRLDILSQQEVNKLVESSAEGGCYDIYRRCSLAVLNVGSDLDDTKTVLEKHKDFDIRVIQQERGIKIEVINAPGSAFVDGKMITGIQEHLFSVLRDIVYVRNEVEGRKKLFLARLEQRVGAGEYREQIDDVVFGMVPDAQVLVLERRLQRLTEKLAHVGDGQEFHGVTSDLSAGRFCRLRRSSP